MLSTTLGFASDSDICGSLQSSDKRSVQNLMCFTGNAKVTRWLAAKLKFDMFQTIVDQSVIVDTLK